MALGNLTVSLIANIKAFLKNLGVAKAQLIAFGLFIEQFLLSTQGKIALGLGALVASFAILGSQLKKALGPAIDFQQQLANVSTIVVQDVAKNMENFRRGVLDIAIAFGEGTKTITKGLYDILSATFAPVDAMNLLTVSMRAARAGLTNTTVAAEGITTILLSYGLQAKDAARVSDLLFETVRRGVVTFEEIATKIGRVASTAAVAGVPLESLMSTFATLTRAGLDVGFSVTSINQTLKMFLSPSRQARIAAEEVGITLDTVTLQTEGFEKVIERLSHLLPEQVAEIFRNIRALRGVNAAIKQVTGIQEDYNFMLDAAGATQRAFEKNASTLKVSLDRLAETGEVLKIEFGTPLLTVLTHLSNAIIYLGEQFRRVNPEVRGTITLIAALTGIITTLIAIIGIPIAILSALGISLGTIATVLGVVLGAVVSVVGAIKFLTKSTTESSKAFKTFQAVVMLFNPAIMMFKATLIESGVAIKFVSDNWAEFRVRMLSMFPVLIGITLLLDKFGINFKKLANPTFDQEELNRKLSKSIIDLTTSLDKENIAVDDLERRWKALVDALEGGGKVTEESAEYVNTLIQLLQDSEYISEENRKVFVELFKAIRDGRGTLQDYSRTLKEEALKAFILERAELIKLKSAYENLGDTMISTLRATAKVAVRDFQLIQQKGHETNERLMEIWAGKKGVLNSLKEAFGKDIPAEYRKMHQQITGESLDLSLAFESLFNKMGFELQRSAGEGIQAISILRSHGYISAQNFADSWTDAVEEVIKAYGKIPASLKGIMEEEANITADMIEDFAILGTTPPAIMKKAIEEQVAAFEELRKAGVITKRDQEELWEDLWNTIRRTFKMEEIPDTWKLYTKELLIAHRAEKKALELIEKETVEGIHRKYELMRGYFKLLADENLKSAAIEVSYQKEKEEIFKLTMEDKVDIYNKKLLEIINMDDVDASHKRKLLKQYLEEMEDLNMKGTAIYRKYMQALKDLGGTWQRSFMDIFDKSLDRFENRFAESVANIMLREDEIGRESLDLFRERQKDRLRELRNSLVEGEISHRRYALEVEQINRGMNERMRGEQSKTTRIFKSLIEEMKRAFIKTTAEMLANWITTQMKIGIGNLLGSAVGSEGKGKPFDIKGLVGSLAGLALTALIPLQKGGIVTKPAIAKIGEKGPEAVIPLSKIQRPIELHIHETFDFRDSIPMIDDPDTIDKVWNKYWVPARERAAKKIEKVLNKSFR